MSKHPTSDLVLADSRGRILLPPALRKNRLYEIEANEGEIRLFPVEAKRLNARLEASSSLENSEILTKLAAEFNSKLGPRLHQTSVEMAILFGSRARGDARDKSDFDIALFCKKIPSFSERNAIIDDLLERLSALIKLLARAKTDPEFSFQFLPINYDTNPPALYFSIIEEGRLLWEEKRGMWKSWVKRGKDFMKSRNVKSLGTSPRRTWTWSTSDG